MSQDFPRTFPVRTDMAAIDPTDFIQLYRDTSERLLQIRLVQNDSPATSKCLLSLEHSCLQLTRCGSALGLDTIRPDTDLHDLPEDHALLTGHIQKHQVNKIHGALQNIDAELDRSLVRLTVETATQGTVRGIHASQLNENDMRLAVALRQVSQSRLSGFPDTSYLGGDRTEGIAVSMELTRQIAASVASIADAIAHLDPRLTDLALEEARQLYANASDRDIHKLLDEARIRDKYLASAAETLATIHSERVREKGKVK